jgi:small subunit ribosomal protein S16
MLRIRLQRKGKCKQPFYRIVVMEAKKKREGEAVEVIGSYDPRKEFLSFKGERWSYWVSRGAQPTESVSVLYKRWLNSKQQISFGEGKNVKDDAGREILHSVP